VPNTAVQSLAGTLRPLRLLLAAVVILPLALFAGAAWVNYRWAYDNAEAQLGRTSDAVGEHALKVFETVERSIAEINEVTTAIAAAVEQQGAATREIARNIQHAAGGTSEVSSNIIGVSTASTQAGSAAGEVLSASGALRREADLLRSEIDAFLSNIRAA